MPAHGTRVPRCSLLLGPDGGGSAGTGTSGTCSPRIWASPPAWPCGVAGKVDVFGSRSPLGVLMMMVCGELRNHTATRELLQMMQKWEPGRTLSLYSQMG
jgi:hypothetical protein